MSIGIYKYKNKLNGLIYIGQSVNIESRHSQHLYASKCLNPRSSTGIDYAINEYEIENFEFTIVELCDKELLNERERFWINYYNSYTNGYNRTVGGNSLRGEEHPRAIMTEQQVWDIREQYKNGIKRSEVFKPYLESGITERCLLKIWNCETWVDIHSDVYTEENKNIHRKQVSCNTSQKNLSSLDRAPKQEEINKWVEDYKNGLSINAIAKKYHKDHGTIERYIKNPEQMQSVKYDGRKVKNLETQKIFNSISSAARWAGCGSSTLTRHLYTDKTAGNVPDTNEKSSLGRNLLILYRLSALSRSTGAIDTLQEKVD